METHLQNLKSIVTNPEDLLQPQNHKDEEIREVLKGLYDFSRNLSNIKDDTVLDELVLPHLDEEQIYQQLLLYNDAMVQGNISKVSNLLANSEEKFELAYNRKNEDDIEEHEDEDMSEGNDEDDDDDDEEFQKTREVINKSSGKKSIVDDEFFKLSEMEAFLEEEDKKEMRKGGAKDDGIDYFQAMESDSDDEDEKNLKYGDFFTDIGPRGESDEDEEFEENQSDNNDKNEDEEEETEKSTYQKRQQRLQDNIERLENKALAGKSWQMKGEVTAKTRPKDSLLAEFVEHDTATRPAPIITEQTTLLLEEIIRQRIKDKAYDDVIRKTKPTQMASEYRKTQVLNQEKSKQSLAQVYEEEFLKEAAKFNLHEEKDDEPEAHKTIRKSLASLFAKLDAISNYHFTPRPAAPEVKIITNTPAIAMEEVAPIGMSDANLLAPEEVKRRAKGDVLSKQEMGKTDKNRARRQKKMRQRTQKRETEKLEKLKDGKEKQNAQEKARLTKALMKSRNVEATRMSKIGSIKTSTAFFNMLSEQQQPTLKFSSKKTPKNDTKMKGISAKFVKL